MTVLVGRSCSMRQTPQDNKRHVDTGFGEGWGTAHDRLVTLAETL
ncbi:hypothetical protein FHS43_002511 [Streptosporangium becharense]|uniref:Uncharacterized protein n=1 Tax=Streptosporangium becharense TaxID=1816182 RepID=A0A7W9MIJ7_9ACTN|nr:hypothetical protein [Streptosporangium becharense]MBB2911246.1 hypothetical protein [Streptosporangium becharense]MBB5821696.1 hypothetical protein [Streptosporangium becharense]